jgi:hypothetical protein
MILGAVGSTIGAGTFASFTAETQHQSSTFSTGSVLLTNKKDAGTDGILTNNTCFSNGTQLNATTTSVNGSCDQLINVQVQKPGDTAFVDLTLQNLGNLGGPLKVKASQICTTVTAAGQSYAGGGDACAGARLTIQQYASIGLRSSNDTTGGACWYGGGAGGSTCSFSSSYRLDTFSTSYPYDDSSPALSLGTMPAGGVRLLRITVQLPSDASNNLQGVEANFGFTWTLEQTA